MRRTNLIPDELISAQTRFKFKTKLDYMMFLAFMIMFFLFLAIGIFQLIGMGIFSLQVKARTRKVDVITGDLDINRRIKENIATQVESWQRKISQAEGRIAFLDDESGQPMLWSDVLEKLNSFIPARLWLVRVVLDEKEIKIKGNSYGNLLISTFISNLSNSEIFTNVNLNYAKKKRLKEKGSLDSGDAIERRVIEFEITCSLINSGS